AANGYTGLKSVSIPDTVVSIGNNAFNKCSGLAEIKLPENLETIGNYAFQGCTSLGSVALPASVTKLGTSAFKDCTKLSDVALNEGLQTISGNAFDGCIELAEVTVPSTVTACGSNIFVNCAKLNKVIFAEGTVNIPASVLSGCKTVTEAVLPETVVSVGNSAFANCSALSSIALPSGVETIGNSAFKGCTSLKEVVIPASVKTVSDYAFADCTAVESIKVLSAATTVSNTAFNNCGALQEYPVPHILYTLKRKASSVSGDAELTEDRISRYRIEVKDLTSDTVLAVKFTNDKIILPADKVNAGDELQITVTSGDISQEVIKVTLDDKANSSADIVVKERGYISVPYTENEAEPGKVYAVLFDEEGKNTGITLTGDKGIIKSKALEDGNYNIVIIKTDYDYWNYSDIKEYAERGLENGKDYTVIKADIKSGSVFTVDPIAVSACSVKNISILNMDYTLFTANANQVHVDGLINYTLKYKIKDSFVDKNITRTSLTVALPNNIKLIDNSISFNNAPFSGSTISGQNVLTIPVADISSGTVKFSARPVANGKFETTVKLNYSLDGKSHSEKIDTVRIDVPVVTVFGETTTNTGVLDVSGIAPENSRVDIYDGQELIATTTSNDIGKYSATVKLEKNSERTHLITSVSNDVVSNILSVLYDEGYPAVKEFILEHNNSKYDLTASVLEGTRPYISIVPSKNFKFTIKMTNSNKIRSLYVTSNKNGEIKRIPAVYDKENDVWIAEGMFDPAKRSYVPGTINISFSLKSQSDIQDKLDEAEAELEKPFPEKIDVGETASDIVITEDMVSSNNIPQAFVNATVDIKENTNIAQEKEIRTKDGSSINVRSERTKTIVENGKTVSVSSLTHKDLVDNGYTKTDHGYVKYVINDTVKNPDGSASRSYSQIIIDDAKEDAKVTVINEGLSRVIALKYESKIAQNVFSIAYTGVDLIKDANDAYRRDLKAETLMSLIPEGDPRREQLESIRAQNAALETIRVVEDLGLIAAAAAGISLFTPLGVGILVGSILLDIGLDIWAQELDEEINALDDGAQFGWSVDPSGYVYSGSEDNRLKGVKVSLYYKQNMNDEPQLWNADKYDQTNPTYTNTSGEYAWDVPEGFWQVKCELEGYETTYSDWLTVPPPQFNVNIEMKKTGESETTPEDTETTPEDTETTPEDSETKPEDTETTPEDIVAGDINLDGTVTALDFIILKKYILGIQTLDENQLKAADINNSGSVNVFDIQALVKLLSV
ncbi:MAG: leucine-rich repeat protein, partial [Oscillospiraceae bacterium]|nr:leucine-rich repeat protein [Oscillospiraceae bacterium]